MNVLFLQTGGTIDKDYPTVYRGYSFEITSPAVERILTRPKLNFTWRIDTVLKKDSMDMTDEDRQKIVAACQGVSEKYIIITHGTDSMIETGEALSVITDKVIVLTGAARPELFSNSDADFNVGTAVGALNVLDNGVYIAMNGVITPWNKRKKDGKTGVFVIINS